MLTFLLFSTIFSVPNIESISIEKLYEIMYEPFGLNGTNPTPASKTTTPSEKIYFVIRQRGDVESGEGYKFYNVKGTKEQIAALRASNENNELSDENVTTLNETNRVIFIELTNEATYAQEAVFWVVIVTFVIFIGFVLSSLIIWHTDRYDLDPANSLLFVTEGNTIVSGINDPK